MFDCFKMFKFYIFVLSIFSTFICISVVNLNKSLKRLCKKTHIKNFSKKTYKQVVSCQLDIVGEMRNTDAGAGRVVLLSVFYVEESSQ